MTTLNIINESGGWYTSRLPPSSRSKRYDVLCTLANFVSTLQSVVLLCQFIFMVMQSDITTLLVGLPISILRSGVSSRHAELAREHWSIRLS